jgi:2-keto-4-pentenoate hydratase
MTTAERVVDLLVASREQGHLPAGFPAPSSLDAALEAQLATLEQLTKQGERLAGWKVGFTSGDRPPSIKSSDVAFAFILERGVSRSGAILDRAALGECVIEVETSLVAGESFGLLASAGEAREVVRSAVPALEINQLRCAAGSPIFTVIADGLAHWGIVVGPEVTPPPPAHEGRGTLQRDTVFLSSRLKVADPYESLWQLSLALHRFGLTVGAGQYVLTGSLARDSVPAAGSVAYSGCVDGIGEVKMAFDRNVPSGKAGLDAPHPSRAFP